MIIRLCLGFICTIYYVASFSQIVSGTVKYSDGKPVENALIRILSTEKNIRSDQEGNFSIQLTAGAYSLVVTAAACDTIFKKVGVSFSPVTLAIILTKVGQALNEVVVSATKTAIGKQYTPMNITVVNREQIENSSESALLPVLAEQVPGLFVTERGVTGFGVSTGSAGAISMRGISGDPNNRILVLINGSPQFMGLFGHPLPDAYVASDVEKVEVIHGAGSVLYGTNAMAGVINILTRTQQQDGYSVNARVLYGSFNTQKYLTNIGYRKKGFSLMASVNKDHTDGHRAASAFNITNGYLKLSNRFSEHLQIALETNLAKFNAEDPGPVTGQKGPSVDVFRGSTYLNITNTNNHVSGNFQLFYNYGKHTITDGFRSRDANYGLSLYQSFKQVKNNLTTVGLDYKSYGGKAENIFAMNGQGIVFGDHTIAEWAPYLLTQQTIAKKIILTGGIRLQHNNVYGNIVIPSGGLSFLATKTTTVKALVSKGFRSPSVLDLYLFAPANPDLQPEKMMNYEATVSQLLLNKKIQLDATLFNVQGSNLIETVFQNGGPKNINSGAFNNSGIEFSGKYSISQLLKVSLMYGYTNVKNPVLAVPRQQLSVNSTFKSAGWMFSINFQHIEGLTKQVTPDKLTSSYTLLNAKADYQLSKLFDVFLKGENITNQQYEINNGYPMPGIVLLAGINFHLVKN